MNAKSWQPLERVNIRGVQSSVRHDRLRTSGYTTEKPPARVDGMVKVEVKLDNGKIVLLPTQLVQKI
jgi:hypothetical protein